MSLRVTIDQLREQLPELIRRAAERGEECIIQRHGEDYAVLLGDDCAVRPLSTASDDPSATSAAATSPGTSAGGL